MNITSEVLKNPWSIRIVFVFFIFANFYGQLPIFKPDLKIFSFKYYMNKQIFCQILIFLKRKKVIIIKISQRLEVIRIIQIDKKFIKINLTRLYVGFKKKK